MKKNKKICKTLSLLMALTLTAGNLSPATVKAEPVTVDKNILEGLVPTTNAAGGIANPEAATDGIKTDSNVEMNNTRINAGDEIGGDDNGYSQWEPVYLQYDFGDVYSVKAVDIYRNTYDIAVSTFKDVKVELSASEDFSESYILYGDPDGEDVIETEDSKGVSQYLEAEDIVDAQYLRVWGKGHYIENTVGSWKGYSNGVLFNEIEVIASVEEETPEPGGDEEMVDANIMTGLLPTSNSPHQIVSGNATVPQVQILNPEAATDGVKSGSDDDSNNTKIIAGEEIGGADNGYSGWDHVYLQYDFGKLRDVKEIDLYRNTYPNAVSTFKDVKVELSADEDFAESTIVYDTADYEETTDNKGLPQTLVLEEPVSAQYIRIWERGHYIQNTNSAWKGYSNGILFNEIEVIASIPKSEVPAPPPEEEAQNIALGKIPYVRGLTPTNIEAITDGSVDDNYAVHNSTGERWLQFEYKNNYQMKEICFKLEEGTYQSVKVSVSSSPTNAGQTVFQQNNWTQGADMQTITLDQPVTGRYVRFTVNKDNNSPTKYSEVEIWATGKSYDESKPEYTAPDSKYDTLVWADEFDGDSIDETKWNIIDGMANHAAIYNRDAVSIVKDGEESYLSINSKNYESTDALIDAVGWDQYGSQQLASKVTWSSGRLESKNKFSFQFGRMAVRAKPNDSQGIWPAIWMLCQDETGHDEIDVLEYLGQDSWSAWTTNHFGILSYNKGSHGIATNNYEAWCQDFHVFEVEWDPEAITFFIDGNQVHKTSQARDDGRDGMHTRPMFPILETQVGDGWVGDVDYSKQNTKQDSDFLVDWVRVYQTEDQAVTRFDDLTELSGGTNNDYFISASSATDGLMALTNGEEPYEDKDNFYYGGQPRYEDSRIAVKENAEDQSLVYKIPGVKDVHLTAYYQTLSDAAQWDGGAGSYKGASIRTTLKDNANIDFQVFSSTNGKDWTKFENIKTVDNFPEAYPSYARITFDAYGLPEGTNYVKVAFPNYKGVSYALKSGEVKEVQNTDIQLAKVTFLQDQQETADKSQLEAVMAEAEALTAEDYTEESWNVLSDALDAGAAVMNDETAIAQEIGDAATAIRNAIDSLEEAPEADKTALKSALDKAAKLIESDYTAASWKTLTEAVNAGQKVFDDKKASDSDIKKAAEDIQKAIDRLKKITKTNKTALKNALDKASKLKQNDYTASTWKNLAKAVDAGKKILDNKNASQKDIDKAAESITKAVSDLKKQVKGTWQKNAKGWWYDYGNGKWPAGKWELIEGKWYAFDADGYMRTGWFRDGNTWYYLTGSGAMATGWLRDGGNWYYLRDNGSMATGWMNVGGTWYYLSGSGAMLTGWIKLGQTWYYLNASGAMATGWIKPGSDWYYMTSSGAMATGWIKPDNSWYYLNASGTMATGWLRLGNNWYYLNASGRMATGWIQLGSSWYYLTGSGAMATGWVKDGSNWYYLTASGRMATGWLRLGNSWYYLTNSGSMATGWIKDGGKWYYLTASGSMATGWIKDSGKWYYLNASGAMAQNTWIDNYYVNASGAWTQTR